MVRSDKTAGSHGPVPGVILLDDSFTEASMEIELEQHPLGGKEPNKESQRSRKAQRGSTLPRRLQRKREERFTPGT
jgi:hypothetical protein